MFNYKDNYVTKVIPAMKEKFGLKNVMSIPKITKVTINVGLGRATADKAWYDIAESTLMRITGQKPVHIKARVSISNFKLREGVVNAMKVTLRGKKMEDFINKLVNISFARIRDFRGLDLQKGFDQNGSYTVGIREYNIFPEIKADEVEKLHGLAISFTTTCTSKEMGQEFFKLLGFPFINKEGK